jgi:hypothetical protein
MFARFTFIFAKTDGQWRELRFTCHNMPTGG